MVQLSAGYLMHMSEISTWDSLWNRPACRVSRYGWKRWSVDNALRYTPQYGTVTVKCGQFDGTAWLSVEDSEPGIPQTERDRIFERFYRSHPERADGSGLGLVIVGEVANTHRAKIEVLDSEELGGALIRVVFPAGRPDI